MNLRFLAVLMVILMLSGLTACGPTLYRWDATQGDARKDEIYVVQKGDTLYSIAFRYGLDFRELAKLNGIGSGYTIYPGQQLRLVPAGGGSMQVDAGSASDSQASPRNPTRAPVRRESPGVEWAWPASGELIAGFGTNNATGKGIDIDGIVGDDVRAAASGKVVYAGSGLIGYGKIIIIKHSEEFLSAYGHNEQLFVREGEQVEQGERIATLGRGPESRPLLHFEIRINGKAVDPLQYLPPR